MLDDTTPDESIDWTNICVLCAARDIHTELDTGHCCQACARRLDTMLTRIGRAIERPQPATTTTAGEKVSGSREIPAPCDLDALDPAAVLAPTGTERIATWATLAEWEKLLRKERHLANYDTALAYTLGGRMALATTPQAHTRAALASIRLLRGHADWITTSPDWPLEDYADEITAVHGALARFMGGKGGNRPTTVPCPTRDIDDDGNEQACGNRLILRIADNEQPGNTRVTCHKCGAQRSVVLLLKLALEEDGDPIWVDTATCARIAGITTARLRSLARAGVIPTNGNRADARTAWRIANGDTATVKRARALGTHRALTAVLA